MVTISKFEVKGFEARAGPGEGELKNNGSYSRPPGEGASLSADSF